MNLTLCRYGFAIASSQLTRDFSVDCAPNAQTSGSAEHNS